MLAALRSRAIVNSSSANSVFHKLWNLELPSSSRALSSLIVQPSHKKGLLDLEEVEKVLIEVRADDVKVLPVPKHCDWADYMVLATGRSAWHVKNIAQALVYKSKQKQKGARRMVLPSVEGQEEGKWIVVDSGKVIIHALEEKARAYYDLENLWTSNTSQMDPHQDLEKAFVKIRPKNNSKKPAKKIA